MSEKHLKTNVAQYAAILRNKKLLMLYPPNGPLWVYPGGRLNEGDSDHESALKREVIEELGVEINVMYPFAVEMWSIEGKSHRYGVFFVCEMRRKEDKLILSAEHTEARWMTYEELMKNYSSFPDRAAPGIRLANRLRKLGLL